MDLTGALILASLLIGLLCVLLLVVVLRSQQRLGREVEEMREQIGGAAPAQTALEVVEPEPPSDARGLRSMTIIWNPVKFRDELRFRAEVELAAGDVEVTYLSTTQADPGHGQARRAIAEGAELVVAAGGDGTVRDVASALAGHDVRMGIIPGGTGNLLARNLDIPLDDVPAAVRAIVDGTEHRIDVGWLQSGLSAPSARTAEPHIFLVISGFGADAEIIGATDSVLKQRLGWPAYIVAGIGKLVGRSHDVVITLPDGTEHVIQARTVLIGNVGRLPGGIVLMPDATIDNGHLEILALGWRGAAGFGQILTQVVNPRLAGGPRLSTMQRYLTRGVEVASAKPLPVQLDGDTGPDATHLVAHIEPGALRFRGPWPEGTTGSSRPSAGPEVTER